MPGLTTTLAQDYKIVDGVEAVTFRVRQADGSLSAGVLLTHVSGHALSADEVAALGGLFGTGDKDWALPADQLRAAGITPKPGDELEDAGFGKWELKDGIDLDDFGISYMAPTVKAR